MSLSFCIVCFFGTLGGVHEFKEMMVSLLLEEEIMKYVFLYICVCIYIDLPLFGQCFPMNVCKPIHSFPYTSIYDYSWTGRRMFRMRVA